MNQNSAKRLKLLDTLRGLSLVSMVLYHALWDQVHLVRMPAWYSEGWARLWQQSICWSFILLSGFCWSLGRRPLRHGLTNLGCAGLITLVTLVALPDAPIWWGVLFLLGTSGLLLIPLRGPLERVPPGAGMALSAALFALCRWVNWGSVGLGPLRWTVPRALYRNQLTAALGFPPADFLSSDYFSLIPWFFLYVFGYFLYRLGAERWQSVPTLRREVPVLSWLGRHSLAVYLLHQPVLYLLIVVLQR